MENTPQQVDNPQPKQEWNKPELTVLSINEETLGLLGHGADSGSSHT
jgi:hypothetical protein